MIVFVTVCIENASAVEMISLSIEALLQQILPT